MTIDIQEAIRCYHDAVSAQKQEHVILILDKSLHMFPWESLPCLRGKSVSRLPSLGSLLERVVDSPSEGPSWPNVAANRGFFILNPDGDLTHTQSQFETTFARCFFLILDLLISGLTAGKELLVEHRWIKKYSRRCGITTCSCKRHTGD
jgi:hypothetical protein